MKLVAAAVGVADLVVDDSAQGADDMDLFVLVQKLDTYGTPLQQFTVPNQSAAVHELTERGATILRYKGSDGRLRVSLRHPDLGTR